MNVTKFTKGGKLHEISLLSIVRQITTKVQLNRLQHLSVRRKQFSAVSYRQVCYNVITMTIVMVRVYTVFSFLNFRFLICERKTDNEFLFRFSFSNLRTKNEKRIPSSFFVFKSEVRKTKNEFVFRFQKLSKKNEKRFRFCI